MAIDVSPNEHAIHFGPYLETKLLLLLCGLLSDIDSCPTYNGEFKMINTLRLGLRVKCLPLLASLYLAMALTHTTIKFSHKTIDSIILIYLLNRFEISHYKTINFEELQILESGHGPLDGNTIHF